MTLVNFLIIAASSYLLGSLSFAIIVCRLTLHQDIRSYGSGNAGLTNAYRTMGAKKTVYVLLGDILKGVAAVSVGGLLDGQLGKLIAGVFVVVGHVFPVYFGFRGGKGVLVGAVLLALFDWRIFVIAIVLFVIIVAATRWISLGSICAALTVPFTMHFFYHDWLMTAIAVGLVAAVIFLHRSNIKRILAGKENRFSFTGKPQIQKEQPKIEK
ncbi:glycerol-3-phosphate 1-O-acyltransferase PlsY [Intestinibacillus massiliensis]|uniref:glycerol-3-phosphate 1-O-acyltransferase PlsY n=1 Tax=Intestinibacillus massiliensis TaxID=1871029 RepID=UPI000B351EB7|nr:glycerol-3-phosphate 1-O-acyltransferase PlsY [Intestinibacillus massiliensis]